PECNANILQYAGSGACRFLLITRPSVPEGCAANLWRSSLLAQRTVGYAAAPMHGQFPHAVTAQRAQPAPTVVRVGQAPLQKGAAQAPSLPMEAVAHEFIASSTIAISSGVAAWRLTKEKPLSLRAKKSGAMTRHWSQSIQAEST